ncbi:MAG: hypothetical protein ACE5FL_15735 [Myxococcota bacterium]
MKGVVGRSEGRIRRIAVLLLGLAAFTAFALHLRPLAVWRFNVAPQLAEEPNALRMNVDTVDEFPAAPADWTTLAVDDFQLKAPIVGDQLVHCTECAAGCALHIDGGKLAVFDRAMAESYREALDRFAPDEDDLSLFRSAARNWRSIHALVGRVHSTSALPESFRFAAPGSHGVVTVHTQHDTQRYVVYAYSPMGRPARVLVLSGLSRRDLHRALGSLAFASTGERADPREPASSGCI